MWLPLKLWMWHLPYMGTLYWEGFFFFFLLGFLSWVSPLLCHINACDPVTGDAPAVPSPPSDHRQHMGQSQALLTLQQPGFPWTPIRSLTESERERKKKEGDMCLTGLCSQVKLLYIRLVNAYRVSNKKTDFFFFFSSPRFLNWLNKMWSNPNPAIYILCLQNFI